jgi:hypothetical protein
LGKEGGALLSLAGAVLSIAGFPYIGLPLMMGGGVITQQALKKEAMARMKSAMMGLRMNTRTTERPIPVIYGRQRVGGNVLWMSTEGKAANDFNPPRNKLFVVYGLSEGPIDAYEEMFFNDTKVWDARSGQLRTQFYNAFYSEFHTGTNSQAPFSHVTTVHNLYDIASETFPLTAVAMVEFFYNPDIYQSVPNVTWTIRGKQVPDWTDADSPGIVKWTQSGPLQVADLLTNKQYGMGIASANLNVSDLTSAHLYATGAISPGSRSTVEIVDMSAQRPKYYSRAVQVPANASPGFGEDGAWTITSLHQFALDKVPIKPGSLSFVSNLGSAYYDSPRSGMISEFGRILGAGAAQVGSVNYLTGALAVNRPPIYSTEYADQYQEVFSWNAKWYADWEFSYRTKYQSVARSMSVVSTPETLVETGTVTDGVVTLYSTQGGAGTFNYGTGELNVSFGAHEWYDNQPVEVWYRVNTRARFSTNYPLFEPEKVMDAIKNIQNHYRGFLVYANGKYGIRADKAEGSVYSFDDDNIVAGSFRMHQPSIKEIPTRVTLKYLDALNNFTPAEASFDVRSVDPGMEIEHVLDMPGVNARDEAMATSYSYANLANLVNFIEFETNHNAIGVEAGDVVDVTHPAAAWSQKLFRVLGISFAKDDKLAISAIEHDPSAYVDDWIQGPMISRNPSFFPKRSYWPPNVSSATLWEYSRTLSDGTVTPVIKYQIHAVDSAYLAVDHWNVYYSNAARGQQMRLGFSGVNTVGYLSPVEPGWNNIAIHAVSDFGNESAKAWIGSLQVFGTPEHEWQNWRKRLVNANVTITDSGDRNIISSWMEGVSLGTAKYIAVQDLYFSVGTCFRVNQILGNKVTKTLVISAGLANNAIPYLMPSSGGNLFVFFSDEGMNIRAGAILTPELTYIVSLTNIASENLRYATPWCGPTGKMAVFGLNATTSQFVWMPLSSNLAPGAVNSFCAVSSLRQAPVALNFDYHMSPFSTGSVGGLIVSGIHNTSSGSRLKQYVFTFSAGGPNGAWYLQGSMFSETNTYHVSSTAYYLTSVRAAGDSDGRVLIAYSTDPSTGNSLVNPVFGVSFVGSMLAPQRFFSDATDVSTGEYSPGFYGGRPSVFGETMTYFLPKNHSYIASSVTLEMDQYRWYRVSSIAGASEFMDWI